MYWICTRYDPKKGSSSHIRIMRWSAINCREYWCGVPAALYNSLPIDPEILRPAEPTWTQHVSYELIPRAMRMVILDIPYEPWLVVPSLICAADGRSYRIFFMFRSDPKVWGRSVRRRCLSSRLLFWTSRTCCLGQVHLLACRLHRDAHIQLDYTAAIVQTAHYLWSTLSWLFCTRNETRL